MKEKILSISVAAYNVQNTLAETLESFLVSSVIDDIEVIVVNDGSNDKTLSIANEYRTKYPETFIVIDKENGGHGSTINASMRIARGKYYKIVDGDDWVYSANLESYIQQLKECDADIVSTDFVEYYEKNATEKLVRNAVFSDGITRDIEEYIGKRQFAMHEIAVRTSILRKNNVLISENCFYVDHEFMQYSIGFANTLCELDNCIYKYRIGSQGQSVSPINRKKRIKDQIWVLEDLLKWYQCNYLKISEIKRHNSRNNITNMLSYTLESFGYFSPDEATEVQKQLRELWSMIQSRYSAYTIDSYGVAFHLGEKVGMKRKIMFLYQFLMIKSNFRGIRIYIWLRNSRAKKQGWIL